MIPTPDVEYVLSWTMKSFLRADGTLDAATVAEQLTHTMENERAIDQQLSRVEREQSSALGDVQSVSYVGLLLLVLVAVWQGFAIRRLRLQVSRLTGYREPGIDRGTAPSS